MDDYDELSSNVTLEQGAEDDKTISYIGISASILISSCIIFVNMYFCCCSKLLDYFRDPRDGPEISRNGVVVLTRSERIRAFVSFLPGIFNETISFRSILALDRYPITTEMADGGFDPCECIYSHEAAMQRLLTMLRQGQAYCTDTDCTDPPLSNVPGPSPTDPTYMMMALWAVLALMLFFLRPASLRSSPGNAATEKPTAATSSNDNPPPPPPPVL